MTALFCLHIVLLELIQSDVFISVDQLIIILQLFVQYIFFMRLGLKNC